MELCEADYAASFVWNESKQCISDAIYENMASNNIERYNQYYQFHDPITHKLSKFRRLSPSVKYYHIVFWPELNFLMTSISKVSESFYGEL